MDMQHFLETINHFFTLAIVFPVVIGMGLYLTIALRFVQFRKLHQSLRSLTQKNSDSEGNISRFEAISAVLAGNFGTGNISGMAVAITTGGPGALVWMWMMVLFGTVIQYASCILGVAYRRKDSEGNYLGGPMYYLEYGLGLKKAGMLFAVFTLFGALTVGNFAQTNSIILPLEQYGLTPLVSSLVVALFVAIVILGGIKRIANFASYVVPFKAILYLGTALVIIAFHYDQVIPAFTLMIRHAFGFESLIGGVLGASVLKAMTTGFDRGLFATDAGTGIVPILQSSARSEHPVLDGIATLIAPFLVMIVCTATGLVLIVTGAWQTGLESTNMVTHAFSKGLGTEAGGAIVVISLLLFAYTTIIAWSHCGELAAGYLFGKEKAKWFRYLFLILIPLGSLMQVQMIWTLADISITLMLCLNMLGIMGLSKYVIDSSREFQLAESEPNT